MEHYDEPFKESVHSTLLSQWKLTVSSAPTSPSTDFGQDLFLFNPRKGLFPLGIGHLMKTSGEHTDG
jgi:hypothetical protein